MKAGNWDSAALRPSVQRRASHQKRAPALSNSTRHIDAKREEHVGKWVVEEVHGLTSEANVAMRERPRLWPRTSHDRAARRICRDSASDPEAS